MLNRNKTGLAIFENFRIDSKLPKYRKDATGNDKSLTYDGSTPIATGGIAWEPRAVEIDGVSAWQVTETEEQRNERLVEEHMHLVGMYWRRLFKKWFGWLFIFQANKQEKTKLTAGQFFAHIKTSVKNIEPYQKRVEDYLQVANKAKQMGQTALYEQLVRDAAIVKYESLLLTSNFKTCITEAQVIKFYKESPRGMSLTWVDNFTRIIPQKAYDQKLIADELKVFDNYVILHYDPKQKSFALTQKQIADQKDPILFGVIAGINKLYYIADWVDEYCDLTLQQFIDKFGADAITANDITVNYKATQNDTQGSHTKV